MRRAWMGAASWLLLVSGTGLVAGCDSGSAPPQPAPRAGPATIESVSGTWTIDLDASRRHMDQEIRAQLATEGQKLTEERIAQLVERGLDALNRSSLQTTIRPDKSYVSSVAGQSLRGTVTLDGDGFVMIPENNAGLARYRLVGERLVSQPPKDPRAQYLPMVLVRR